MSNVRKEIVDMAMEVKRCLVRRWVTETTSSPLCINTVSTLSTAN
ncbi:hypothetical protein HanRHA438_Chr12g0573301 [Helianthus annuus]|nr:hypothetical protein HanRHA438_Chr12g0573301 [Helianthus annuus]